jgi:hypothetical protein
MRGPSSLLLERSKLSDPLYLVQRHVRAKDILGVEVHCKSQVAWGLLGACTVSLISARCITCIPWNERCTPKLL